MPRNIFLVYIFLTAFACNTASGQVETTNSPANNHVLYSRVVDSLTALIHNSSTDKQKLAPIYFLRGEYYRTMMQYGKAYNDYTSAIKINPGYKDAYWNRGATSEAIKNYKDAISDYKKVLELLPEKDSANIARLYSNIAFDEPQLHDDDQALAYDSIAIKYNPAYGRAYFIRGSVYYGRKDYKTSALYYQKAIKLYTDYRNIRLLSLWYVALGEAQRNIKQYKEAINSFSFAIKLDPDDRTAYLSRAGVYYLHMDYELATNDFNKAITYYQGQDKLLSQLYYDKANAELGQSLYLSAIKDDSTAIALNPENRLARYDIAMAYRQNDKYQESIDMYKKALGYYRFDKNSESIIYYRIADDEYFLNQFEKAVKDCSTAISLIPANMSAYYYRGKVYLQKLDKKDLAMQDFNKVMALDTSRKSLSYIGSLFYTGKQQEAVAIMQQQILTITDDADLCIYYYNLAGMYAMMNKTDEANNYLKMAIDKGYSKKIAVGDVDLENIRNTTDYRAMMGNGK